MRFKRGTNSARTFTPDDGEPVWENDRGHLFMGDGTSAGGVWVGPSSHASARQTSAQLFSAVTPVQWNANQLTSDYITHSTTTNNDEFVLEGSGTGYYQIYGHFTISASPAGTFQVELEQWLIAGSNWNFLKGTRGLRRIGNTHNETLTLMTVRWFDLAKTNKLRWVIRNTTGGAGMGTIANECQTVISRIG